MAAASEKMGKGEKVGTVYFVSQFQGVTLWKSLHDTGESRKRAISSHSGVDCEWSGVAGGRAGPARAGLKAYVTVLPFGRQSLCYRPPLAPPFAELRAGSELGGGISCGAIRSPTPGLVRHLVSISGKASAVREGYCCDILPEKTRISESVVVSNSTRLPTSRLLFGLATGAFAPGRTTAAFIPFRLKHGSGMEAKRACQISG
jgi:hypothetical protein